MGVKELAVLLFSLIFKAFGQITAYIYNIFYSRLYTKWTYFMVADRMQLKKTEIKSILDVGMATGHPMKQIINRIPKNTRVLGIDIDDKYLSFAKKLFQNYPNVEVRQQNFYDLENANEQFDVIIFGSSLMIMPDRYKALEVAKKRLNKNGSIFFLMTLEDKNPDNYGQQFIKFIKPYLKYLTSIEFGQITYEADFNKMLEENGLKTIYKERVAQRNIFLSTFRMFVVETEMIAK